MGDGFLKSNTISGTNARALGVKPALKCLGAILQLQNDRTSGASQTPPLPESIIAKTHLQMASILHTETKNKTIAKKLGIRHKILKLEWKTSDLRPLAC